MILGIDIGYGYTKAATARKRVQFPSVVGRAERIRYKDDDLIHSNGTGAHLVTAEGEYFVGELALLQSRVRWSPQDRQRTTVANTLLVLAQAAFGELGVRGSDVRVVTGLPVEWYEDREQLVARLRGEHDIRWGQGGGLAVTVADVYVVPQPFGSLFSLILNERGRMVDEELAGSRLGIVDVGTHTTDYVLVDELRYVEKGSGSISTAMSRVCELAGRAIQDEHKLDLSLHEVDRALQAGYVMVYDEKHPLAELARPAVEAVAEEVLSQAGALWGDGRDLAAVLVTGGGALSLFPAIKERYPHARLVDDPALANVVGFYRYGVRKWKT
jgi:plasmid segregation protein ParM